MAHHPPLPTPLLHQIPPQPHPTPPLPHSPHPQLPLPILHPPLPLPPPPYPSPHSPPPPTPSAPPAPPSAPTSSLSEAQSTTSPPPPSTSSIPSPIDGRSALECGSAGSLRRRGLWMVGFMCLEVVRLIIGPSRRIGRRFSIQRLGLGRPWRLRWIFRRSGCTGVRWWGRIYAVADRGGVVFDPKEGSWGYVSKRMDLGWRGRAAVVDGVLYCYDYLGKIRGFVEEGGSVWKQVRGLDKGLPKFMCGATMANVGGNLCVLWEGKGLPNQLEISCALIEICRDSFGELWGSILCSQVILVVPRGSSIVHCLDVAFFPGKAVGVRVGGQAAASEAQRLPRLKLPSSTVLQHSDS
ncbi:hypothetical protein Syun_004894 [Stephania yunnanensis]|uniref:FKB95-like N-terminal Kelch domain-containing protein n=1 Tax=Stephania yunnanensis TaxID=152371 RepID=A0AAP0L3T3_9MAGN